MRKAFTLVEVLVVVTVIPLVAIAFSALFATFIRDVPRMTRLVQENTSVLDVVDHIRKDMDAAVGLPDAFADAESNDRTLLIALPDGVVRYEIQDTGVTRTVFDREDGGEPRGEGAWRFRHAVIAWQLWKQNDRAYAVEVRTFLRERISGRVREKLANSYVCFIHGLARAEDIP